MSHEESPKWDMFLHVRVKLDAAKSCMRRPDFNPKEILGHQVTDDDYKEAIRIQFKDVEGFEDSMLDTLLESFKLYEDYQKSVEDTMEELISKLLW